MFPADGPQWRLTNIHNKDGGESAWIFAFNHGIDDQQSVNILTQDLLDFVSGNGPTDALPLPPNVESAICPGPPNPLTLLWSIYQLYNSLRMPTVVPRRINEGLKSEADKYSNYADPDLRETICEVMMLSEEATARLRQRSKEEGVTVTNTLAAAMLVINAMLVLETDDPSSATPTEDVTLRFLLSVGLRPYGVESSDVEDWSKGTVACAGGAIDYIMKVSHEAYAPLMNSMTASRDGSALTMTHGFWDLARGSQELSKKLIDMGFVPESQRLFGIGMEVVDILKAVEIEARNRGSLGRGYTCGVSSVGLVNFSKAKVSVKGVFYGTSHGRNGVLSLLSCMTVNGVFTGCLQFPSPLIDRIRAEGVRSTLERILNNL